MLCCMFKYRRSSLVRRLWRLRLQHETRGTAETKEELELKSLAHTMLKQLKDSQLEAFVRSVESQGGEECDCVFLPKVETRVGKKSFIPVVLCCKMWRWPDITDSTWLKRLPCCISKQDSMYECCNPFHWSLLTVPDIPGIDHGDLSGGNVQEKLADNFDRSLDECASRETCVTPTPRQNFLVLMPPGTVFKLMGPWYTNASCLYDFVLAAAMLRMFGSDDERSSLADSSSPQCVAPDRFDTGQSSQGSHWCTLAYWEHSQRVGRLLTVFDTHINIFQQLPHGDGLCLKILQEYCTLDSVTRTREKIGFGIVLSKGADGIWVYNRSQFPIFVNSPTLDNPKSRTLSVHKVLPGYSMKIFNYEQAQVMDEIPDPKYLDGPYDSCSMRISFAKGWGPHYSRQFLTSCPAWLEIMLNIDR